jgi:hypothetical protein
MTTEQQGSTLVKKKQWFRKFDSLDDAFKYRADLLKNHYPLAMAHTDDPDAFVAGLEADPHHMYATDSHYVEKVTGAMRDNDYSQYDLRGMESEDGSPGVHISHGEPTVMLGTKQQMAGHVESPHTGGGQVAQGSATVAVGPKQLPFARQGDVTTDQLFVKGNVQPDVFVGGPAASSVNR